MGLISKIEDKLSSSSHKKEEQQQARLDNQTVGSTQQQQHPGTTDSHLQHPIGSNNATEGSGITGSTALSGHQDPAYTGTNTTNQDHHNLPGTTTTSHGQRGNDIDIGSRDHAVPRKPFDPYSSKGQKIAANAADSRDGSYEDSSSKITRSRDGGITNAGENDKDFVTGPHSSLQNPSAVPTAGGQKVGGGETGPYDSVHDNSLGSHHHGTHGGSGVVRASEPTRREDVTHQHSGTGHSGLGSHLPGSNTTTTHHQHDSGIQTGVHDRHHGQTHANDTYGQNVSYGNRPSADTPLAQDESFAQRHTGPTTMTTSSQHGAGGQHTGSHLVEKLTGGMIGGGQTHQPGRLSGQQGQKYDSGYQQAQQHHQDDNHLPGHTIGSGIGCSGSGLGGESVPQQQGGLIGTGAGAHGSLPTEKKLGGAYEAGYRDAVQHLQAERKN